MTIKKLLLLKTRSLIAVFAFALAIPVAFAGSANAATGCQYTSSGGLLSGLFYQTQSSSTEDDAAYSSTSWTDVACGSPHDINGTGDGIILNNQLIPGQQATITVSVSAETLCVGIPGQWCEARVLLDGVDMNPNPDTFPWSPPSTTPDWSTHSFSRTKVVSCPLLTTGPLGLPIPNLAPCPIGKIKLQTKEHGSVLNIDSLNVRTEAHGGLAVSPLPPL